ncbi:hypothetical protein GCM10009555_027690 [Acrocarpospora macrocephala]|uniref:Uncharacterized protein n=1 Tax=Acrocarpospora macrocephala TaxID=150177 RepID=A0A5M3X4J4_9ACTN|nr:hypothetical protein [Acrocarpospora macrocephala]GES15556.1 hypothetical protein Amac_091530 [Acrocarpospora macrocephala]
MMVFVVTLLALVLCVTIINLLLTVDVIRQLRLGGGTAWTGIESPRTSLPAGSPC